MMKIRFWIEFNQIIKFWSPRREKPNSFYFSPNQWVEMCVQGYKTTKNPSIIETSWIGRFMFLLTILNTFSFFIFTKEDLLGDIINFCFHVFNTFVNICIVSYSHKCNNSRKLTQFWKHVPLLNAPINRQWTKSAISEN